CILRIWLFLGRYIFKNTAWIRVMASFTALHIPGNMTDLIRRETIMNRRVRRSISSVSLAFLLLVLLAGALGATALAQESKLVVFAAASLKDALDEVNAAYRREKNQEISTSYASSSTLAKQIEAAAPADIFISADLDWMD